MKHLDLFSGIGGFALAVDWVWSDAEHTFCEIDPFCQQVLKKHWPNAKIYGDIKTLTNTTGGRERASKQTGSSNGESEEAVRGFNRGLDLLTGGFPCQPFSQAGVRKGTSDARYLWPEMLRIISEFRPTWVIAENVRGLLSIQDGVVFEQVCLDLEKEGYEVWPLVIPACAVGAPHRRDRIWFVACNTKHNGQHGSKNTKGRVEGNDRHTQGTQEVCESKGPNSIRIDVKNPISKRSRRGRKDSGQVLDEQSSKTQNTRSDWPDWSRSWQEVAFATCDVSMDDGLSRRMVRLPDGSTISEAKWRQQALKGYGNAIVPQVTIEIMRAIKSV